MISHAADPEQQPLLNEIADLERRLRDAKAQLTAQQQRNGTPTSLPTRPSPASTADLTSPSPHHFLLLLADSALPLGSFAFSSGLESYLAHVRPPSFPAFLSLSLNSYASAALPFVLAAYRHPAALLALDDACDAAIMCTVGRRASVAQGRALLSIWDRSFAPAHRGTLGAGQDGADDELTAAVAALAALTAALKAAPPASAPDLPPPGAAHLAPLFGAVARVLGLGLREAAYVFLLGHVKALLSAGVRASLFGPFHAQKVLAGRSVSAEIERVMDREWETRVEDAGQCVPVLDLWMGRHEMLYSRIFNS